MTNPIARRRAFRLTLTGMLLGLTSVAASAQSERDMRCAQLEQELANDWQYDNGMDDQGSIQAEIQRADRLYQQGEQQAERAGCYENFFIFGRGLVRTPRCIRLHNQIEEARRQLARLQQQRDAGRGGGNRRRDRIMEALARNGCGSQYQQQARREPRGFFEELFGGVFDDPMPRRDGWTTSRIDPGMTYRTLCVRTCDGYYYPISYSVMPTAFSSQQAQCQSQCAAPAELYVHMNPGGQVEEAVSLDGRAYMDLNNAFRYRKEYVKGCSCKTAEFNPAEIEAFNNAPEKKAEGGAAPKQQSAVKNHPADELPAQQARAPKADALEVPALPDADPEPTASIAPAEGEASPANESVAPARQAVQAAPANASVAQKRSDAPPRR